ETDNALNFIDEANFFCAGPEKMSLQRILIPVVVLPIQATAVFSTGSTGTRASASPPVTPPSTPQIAEGIAQSLSPSSSAASNEERIAEIREQKPEIPWPVTKTARCA